ncbi:MAG TPA: PQQ-dependent sugar dehydrogenase [Dehalococcoidia bacterium]|nr:PQQ-dependent sugar dehydrogenase [Dehalococcoidia bacterium]
MRRRAPVIALAAAGVAAAAAGLVLFVSESESPSPSPSATVIPSPSPSATPTSTAVAPTASPIACPSAEPPPAGSTRADIAGAGYRLTPVLPEAAWDDMLEFALIPGTENEAVISRQNGEIWRVSLDGSSGPTLFGNLDPIVESGGEQGLLSLAFSPSFQSDGRIYVYYTRGSPDPSVLSRFQATPACLDTASETVIIKIPQPYANHNGGDIVFGQDGYVYLSLGDGGSGGDPHNNAQNPDSLLGKVLRLDVTGQDTYAIPPDNPFADGGGLGEIYAYGLRNPWRMSMDRLTGDIWLGDVGQNAWEEVDRIRLGGNYGWRCYEGFERYNFDGCSTDSGDYVFPRIAYPQGAANRAVAGGYVYRGSAIPGLSGRFIYADSYSGRIWAVNTTDESDPVELMDTGEFIYGFAELADGELLVLTAKGIYELAPAA